MMQWILRGFFLLFALVLSFQVFPPSLSPVDVRGLAVAALVAGLGIGLEALARRVEARVLAGTLLGLCAGAAVGAFLWKLIPEGEISGISLFFLHRRFFWCTFYLWCVQGTSDERHVVCHVLNT